MTEYVKVRKDEYDELVDIKSTVEILKDIYLPSDVKFVLLTKNDYVRNRIEPLQKKIDDLKEWLEEENEKSYEIYIDKVLERLG